MPLRVSEVNFQAELNYARRIGLIERSAKVDRIGRVGVRISEDHAVEQVEELGAKLNIRRFSNVCALDDGEVFVHHRETPQIRFSPRTIPECKRSGLRPGIDVQIGGPTRFFSAWLELSPRDTCAGIDIRYSVWSVATSKQRYGSTTSNTQRKTAIVLANRGCRPASKDLTDRAFDVCPGEVIDKTKNEKVGPIQVTD